MARKIRKENNCYGCPECKNCGRDEDYNYEYLECDKCKEDADKLYVFEGKELCYDCLMEEIEVIE